MSLLLLALGAVVREVAARNEGRAQPWAWLEGILVVLAVAGVPPVGAGQAAILLHFCPGLAALSAMVVRYRRAAGVERRQLTWFLYAAVLAAVVLVINGLELTRGRPWAALLGAVGFGLFPVAVAVAVLRDRLYELDPSEIATGLPDAVIATVAPTRVTVWLRVPSGQRPVGP